MHQTTKLQRRLLNLGRRQMRFLPRPSNATPPPPQVKEALALYDPLSGEGQQKWRTQLLTNHWEQHKHHRTNNQGACFNTDHGSNLKNAVLVSSLLPCRK
jgi:hypothetical protein